MLKILNAVKNITGKQKVTVTIEGTNYEENLNYLMYNLNGRPSGYDHPDDNIPPIKTEVKVIKHSPLIVQFECSKKYKISEYLNSNDINYKVMQGAGFCSLHTS